MPRWMFLWCLVSLAFCACTEQPAQLVVIIDSDYASDEITCVGVTVTDVSGDEMTDQAFEIGPGALTLPFSFGVTPVDGDSDRSVRVLARGFGPGTGRCPDPGGADARTLVARTAQTGFIPETRLRLPMFLSSACEAIWRDCPMGFSCVQECDDLACDEAMCRPEEVLPEDLEILGEGEEGTEVEPDPRGDCGWSDPVPVSELNSVEPESTVSLTRDQLMVYFSRGGGGGVMIFSATRASIDVPFELPSAVIELAGTSNPSVSADGLKIFVTAGVRGDRYIEVWDRSVRSTPFSRVLPPLDVVNLPTEEQTPRVSPDLRSLYFSNEGEILATIRANATDPFGGPARVTEINSGSGDVGGSLTDDNLTIVLSSRRMPSEDYDLWIATRATESEPFDSPTHLDTLSSTGIDWNPYISPDGLNIYFGSSRVGSANNDIYMSERPCVP